MLGSFLPFQAQPYQNQPYQAQPQLDPQGIFGRQLGSLLGGYGGGLIGQSGLGQQLGGMLGGLLPFQAQPWTQAYQAQPQLDPQGIFGRRLGSILGGIGGGAIGQHGLGQQVGGMLGSFLPFQAQPFQTQMQPGAAPGMMDPSVYQAAMGGVGYSPYAG
jgi:hypothetical protein